MARMPRRTIKLRQEDTIDKEDLRLIAHGPHAPPLWGWPVDHFTQSERCKTTLARLRSGRVIPRLVRDVQIADRKLKQNEQRVVDIIADAHAAVSAMESAGTRRKAP